MERLAEKEFAQVRDRLYPMLMSPAQVQEKGGGQMVAVELAEGLFVVYVQDMDRHRVRYVTFQDLREWGVSQTVLHITCVKNLEKLSASSRFTKLDQPDKPNPMFVWNQQDGYDAARLLLHPHMRQFAGEVSGPLIFAVPDRHWLVAVGGDDPQLVDFVARKARERYEGAHFPVSPYLYVWVDGAIERYR